MSTSVVLCRARSVSWCASPAGDRARSSTAGARSSACRSGGRREGALFSSCAYLRWDPAPLAELLYEGEQGGGRVDLVGDLLTVAVGVRQLEPPVRELDALRGALLDSFGALGMGARGGAGGSGGNSGEGDPGAP